MKLIAEAGTDTAAVTLFDPTALPKDFDARYRDGPIELIDELEPQGRFFYCNTGSDGAYLLHLYVDESIAEELRPYCMEPIEYESFHVPSGALWFTGAEYAFRQDDSLLKKYPHMGSQVALDPGCYAACFFRTEYPDEYVEEKVRLGMNEDENKAMQSDESACCIGCAVSVFIVMVLLLTRFAWWVWPFMISMIFYWTKYAKFRRSPKFVKADQHKRAIEINYPSIIAEFRSINLK